MFSTLPTRRSYTSRTRQEASSPPPGSDSCYGVRSLESSVCSEDNSDASPHSTNSTTLSDSVSIRRNEDDWEVHATPHREPTLRAETTPMADYQRLPETPASPVSSLYPDTPADLVDHSTTSSLPPSPDDTLHPRDAFPDEETRNDDKIELERRLSLARLSSVPTLPSSPHTEGPSVPSSPASIAFSCIASLSSISRASSPVSGIAYGHPVGLGIGNAGGDDLVLPTMNLPSSSLHMSLPKFQGEVDGIKIGVVGTAASIQELIGSLEAEDGLGLVDVGKGLIGVTREEDLLVTLVTSNSLELVQRRVNDGYAGLDELLNPALPHGKQDQMKKLAREHSTKNDWIHLVAILDQDQGVLTSLAEIAPVVTTFETDVSVLTLKPDAAKTPDESRAATPSPPRMTDETPMPLDNSAASYFSQSTPSALPSPSLDLLLRAMASPSTVIDASVEHFFAWRGAADSPTPLHSSFTSTSPSVSSYEARHPMPTVARASGGKQWEADGSRRIATEKERTARRRYSNRRAERPKRPEKEKCGSSLFPKGSPNSSPKISSTGLGDTARSIWIATKRWKWGIVAAAAVVLVGWGWEYWARVR